MMKTSWNTVKISSTFLNILIFIIQTFKLKIEESGEIKMFPAYQIPKKMQTNNQE